MLEMVWNFKQDFGQIIWLLIFEDIWRHCIIRARGYFVKIEVQTDLSFSLPLAFMSNGSTPITFRGFHSEIGF